MTTEPLTATCGATIKVNDSCPTLASLHTDSVQALFRETGLVMFRGFDSSVREFDALARRLSIDLMPGVGRATFPEFKLVHLVNETRDALEAHSDNGTRPEQFRPDITWMLCEMPSESGGETTVFDGVAIWQRLSADTRELLRRSRIAFWTRYSEAAWRSMRFADLDAFRRFVESVGATMHPPDADGSVNIEVKCSAYRRTNYGGHDAFVSSISLAGAKGFEMMTVRLEDGAEIPGSVMADIKAAITASCELVHWEVGDVLMIDNTRFLHGRRAFADGRRRMYLLQTHKANF